MLYILQRWNEKKKNLSKKLNNIGWFLVHALEKQIIEKKENERKYEKSALDKGMYLALKIRNLTKNIF